MDIIKQKFYLISVLLCIVNIYADDVTCNIVKAQYQHEGCCSDSSGVFGQCEELDFADSKNIKSNQDYDAHTAYFAPPDYLEETIPTHVFDRMKLENTYAPVKATDCFKVNHVTWADKFIKMPVEDRKNILPAQFGFNLTDYINLPQWTYLDTLLDRIGEKQLNYDDSQVVSGPGCVPGGGPADKAGWCPYYAPGNCGENWAMINCPGTCFPEWLESLSTEDGGEYTSSWDQAPIQMSSQGFAPDHIEMTTKGKVFVANGGHSFYEHTGGDLHYGSRIEKAVVSHKPIDPKTDMTPLGWRGVNSSHHSMFIRNQDGGNGRGLVRVVGNTLIHCGVASYQMRGFYGYGCAEYDLDPTTGGLLQNYQTHSKFYYNSLDEIWAPVIAAKKTAFEAANPGHQFKFFAGLNEQSHMIADEKYSYILARMSLTAYNMSDGTETKLPGSDNQYRFVRFTRATGAVTLSGHTGWTPTIAEQGLGRGTKLALDDQGHIHVFIRIPSKSVNERHNLTASGYDMEYTGSETLDLIRFRKEFTNGENPVGRVPLSIRIADTCRGACGTSYYSMHEALHHKGHIYVTSGPDMYYVEVDYGWEALGSTKAHRIDQPNNDAPLEGSTGFWENGIDATANSVFFYWKLSSFEYRYSPSMRQDAQSGGLSKSHGAGAFTRDVGYSFIEIDTTSTPVYKKNHKITQEEWQICYSGRVSKDGSYVLLGCGIPNGRGRDWYDTGNYKLGKFFLTDTEPATFKAITQSDKIMLERKTPTIGATRSMSMQAEGFFGNAPGGINGIKLNTTSHAMLYTDLVEQNTFFGSNLMNMGRANSYQWTNGNADWSMYHDNVVLGTDLGNAGGGMAYSVLIGSNMGNYNPGREYLTADEMSAQDVRRSAIKDLRHYNKDHPQEGVLAIGFNHTALIGGNFMSKTVNLAQTKSLADTKTAVDSVVSASMENVLFSTNNIVQQAAGGIELDGVQQILDRLTGLEYQLCVLNGGNATTCAVTEIEFLLKVVADTNSYATEVAWSFDKWDSGTSAWKTLIGWDGISAKVQVTDFGLTFVGGGDAAGDDAQTFTFKGVLKSGKYRVSMTDSFGDGWQIGKDDFPGGMTLSVGGTVGADNVMTGGVTESFLMGEKDWFGTSAANTGITPDADGCYANVKPCGAEVIVEFDIPLTGTTNIISSK